MFENIGPKTSRIRDGGAYYLPESKGIDFLIRVQA